MDCQKSGTKELTLSVKYSYVGLINRNEIESCRISIHPKPMHDGQIRLYTNGIHTAMHLEIYHHHQAMLK